MIIIIIDDYYYTYYNIFVSNGLLPLSFRDIFEFIRICTAFEYEMRSNANYSKFYAPNGENKLRFLLNTQRKTDLHYSRYYAIHPDTYMNTCIHFILCADVVNMKNLHLNFNSTKTKWMHVSQQKPAHIFIMNINGWIRWNTKEKHNGCNYWLSKYMILWCKNSRQYIAQFLFVRFLFKFKQYYRFWSV